MIEGDWIVVFLVMNALVLTVLWILARKKND